MTDMFDDDVEEMMKKFREDLARKQEKPVEAHGGAEPVGEEDLGGNVMPEEAAALEIDEPGDIAASDADSPEAERREEDNPEEKDPEEKDPEEENREEDNPEEENSVNPEDSFRSLDIQPEILRSLEELGFAQMTPIQKQAIPLLMEGRDVIGQAQTGTGKTAAFGIPLLQKVVPEDKHIQALVLCPTRELAMQAAADLRDFAKYMHGVKVLPVYGGQEIFKQIEGLKGVQIIVGTPGRVMDHMRRHTIKLNHLSMVILDEADEMLDMGFRDDMETILKDVEQEHQTCLFSATMPQEILNLTDQFQKDPVFVKVTKEELTVASIRQYFYGVKHEFKTVALCRLLTCYRYSRCIVFCNTKTMVDELSAALNKEGFCADGLHGDLNQRQRDFVMGRFRSGDVNVLIATDIAARGLDVDDVEAVINFDLPLETEYYVHRIGRTGRAGKEGVSHSFCSGKEFNRLHEIENVIHVKMQERRIPEADEMREAQEQMLFDRVIATLADGHSGRLIPMVREYCEKNGITAEAFAAAAVKMQLPELRDDVEVGLTPKEKKKVPWRGSRFGAREDEKERRDVRRDPGKKAHAGKETGEKDKKRKKYPSEKEVRMNGTAERRSRSKGDHDRKER